MIVCRQMTLLGMSNLSNTHFKRKCRVESAVLPSHSMSSLKKTKVSPSYGKHIEDNICIYHLDMATKVKVIPLQVWWQKFNRKSTCTTQGKKSRRMANDDRIYQLAEVECNQRNGTLRGIPSNVRQDIGKSNYKTEEEEQKA